MSWIVEDLASKDHFIKVNRWNWYPTLELIGAWGIIDSQRLEWMTSNGDVTITEKEAQEIGTRLNAYLSILSEKHRLQLNLKVTEKPDDFKLYEGKDMEKNYSATYQWLIIFKDFCLTSKGFIVG